LDARIGATNGSAPNPGAALKLCPRREGQVEVIGNEGWGFGERAYLK
jgi:hypothetical protein